MTNRTIKRSPMKDKSDLILYGRDKGKGKFKPVNLADGSFTTNLIYASRWPYDKFDYLVNLVKELEQSNPGLEFEIRQGGGSLYGYRNEDKPVRAPKPMKRVPIPADSWLVQASKDTWTYNRPKLKGLKAKVVRTPDGYFRAELWIDGKLRHKKEKLVDLFEAMDFIRDREQLMIEQTPMKASGKRTKQTTFNRLPRRA